METFIEHQRFCAQGYVGKENKLSYPCKFCGVNFSRLENLIKHINQTYELVDSTESENETDRADIEYASDDQSGSSSDCERSQNSSDEETDFSCTNCSVVQNFQSSTYSR